MSTYIQNIIIVHEDIGHARLGISHMPRFGPNTERRGCMQLEDYCDILSTTSKVCAFRILAKLASR